MKDRLTAELKLLKTRITPDPAFSYKLKQELLNENVKLFELKSFWSKFPVLKGAGIALGVLFLFVLPTITFARNSTPGNMFYPVKRIIEHTQIKIAPTQEKKDELTKQFAKERIMEFKQTLKEENPQNSELAADEVIKVLKSTNLETTNDQYAVEISTIDVAGLSEKHKPFVEKILREITLKNKTVEVNSTVEITISPSITPEATSTLAPTPATKAGFLEVLNSSIDNSKKNEQNAQVTPSESEENKEEPNDGDNDKNKKDNSDDKKNEKEEKKNTGKLIEIQIRKLL